MIKKFLKKRDVDMDMVTEKSMKRGVDMDTEVFENRGVDMDMDAEFCQSRGADVDVDPEFFENRGVDIDMDTAWNRCPPNSRFQHESPYQDRSLRLMKVEKFQGNLDRPVHGPSGA